MQFCQYYRLSFAKTTHFHVSELCSSANTTDLVLPKLHIFMYLSCAFLPILQTFIYHRCAVLPILQTSKSSSNHIHIKYCFIEHVIVSGLYPVAVPRFKAAGVSSWLLRTSAGHGELLTHSVRTSTACQWQWRIYSFVASSLFPFTSFPHTNSVSNYQLCRSFETYFLPLLLDLSTCMQSPGLGLRT